MRVPASRATTIVFSLFAAGIAAGAWTGSRAADRARDPYAPLDTLVRVIGLIETTWVDDITTDELVDAAIQGMLDRLDPHSAWMSAERWRDLQRETHGSYAGIGVEVHVSDEGARITRVLPGSPASRDGLAEGDLILRVDGRPLQASDLEGGESAFLGPRGEPAHLEVLRSGWDAPREIETVRDEVRVPAVTSDWLENDVAYARIAQFQEGAATELSATLARMSAERRPRALVLDLRDNPGGLLREAVDVVDLFVDDGVIVSTWGRMTTEQREHLATPGALDLPMVVLVNGLSASAAEIVAGALQDTGRATLIGTRTYGKGTVQTVFEHRDGSALKLTIGRYFTPSGEPVAPRDGRTPDVEVVWPEARDAYERLADAIGELEVDATQREELQALLDAVPTQRARPRRSPIPWETPLARRLPDDPQLQVAHAFAREIAR